MKTSIRQVATCLGAVALALAGAATAAMAAAPALQGSISLRPLTPSEIKDYGLPSNSETSGGLSAVGVGQPVYLDALVNAAIAPSNIVSVTWTLTNKPVASAAVLTDSPLGTNVPTYKMADRYNQSGVAVLQVAGRRLLRPDVTGQYTITATIVTTGSGSTNLTQTISAGTYMGVQVCAFCHSGGLVAENVYVPWTNTLHASMFSRGIDGLVSSHYGKSCITCHTLGYDTNALAVNGGFDDVAAQLGWTFPTVLTNGNWASMQANYPSLANLANIQCENCHGPGSEHAMSFGNTNLSNWPRIGISLGAGDCGQCHDSKTGHIKNAEWNNSVHARTTRTPSGPTRNNCVRCHTAGGFIGYAENLGSTNTYTTNTVYEAITCQACHDPHDATNPHQLRVALNYTLPDGTAVTNAGYGALCMNCHHVRNGSAANNIAQYPIGGSTWAGGSNFGVHDGPQGDMLEGANAFTYGRTIPSSAHRYAVTNTCVGCHMQPVANGDPAFLQAGGHTFSMTYNVVSNGVTNTLDKVDVCVQCHGPKDSFDFQVQDYNGDGLIEGVQSEVQHLLDQLSMLLPNSSGVIDGAVKSLSVKTNWTQQQLMAAWNWQFVNNDGSKGVHNAPFATGLLKASIADLTGITNSSGPLSASDLAFYQWQVQNFGSASVPNAAPNANPAGDGIPNWLKYNLGLNPWVAGQPLTNGIVWANVTALGGATNTVHIYTAAEVAFDTRVGVNYQIQAISSLGDGWQDVGGPITGTGGSISYLTPTRNGQQQYFRVVTNP